MGDTGKVYGIDGQRRLDKSNFCVYNVRYKIDIPPVASVAGSKAVFRDGLSIFGR